MFLIKQLYRYIPAPCQLAQVLDNRFHLINTFQLGDLSKENQLRNGADDLHMGSIPIILFKVIYYILLGFSCVIEYDN